MLRIVILTVDGEILQELMITEKEAYEYGHLQLINEIFHKTLQEGGTIEIGYSKSDQK